MVWLLLWFQNRAALWTRRAEAAPKELAAYAHRQADNWDRMKHIAHTIFLAENHDLAEVFGYHEFS